MLWKRAFVKIVFFYKTIFLLRASCVIAIPGDILHCFQGIIAVRLRKAIFSLAEGQTPVVHQINSVVWRFTISVVIIFLAIVLRVALFGMNSPQLPYMTFYPAVIFISLFWGGYAGIIGTLVSAALASYWVQPTGIIFVIDSISDMLGMAFFVASGIAIAWVSEAKRHAETLALKAEAKAEAEAVIATEREASADIIRQSEARYRCVVEDQTELILRYMPDGTILFVNEIFCRYFGKNPEALLSGIWHPFTHPEDVPLVQKELERLTPENPVVVIENRVLNCNGEVRWLQCVNRAFFELNGALKETQAVCRDITERKEGEDKLRQAREFLEKIMIATPNAIHVIDHEGRFVMGNAAGEHLLGYSMNELLGQSFTLAVPPEAIPSAEALFRQVAFQGEAFFDQERPILCKDGSIKTVLLSNAPLMENGAITAVVGIATDITERKHLENSLKQAKETAETANRAKSAFLANMSHELRTPMNGVLGMTELALMSDIPPRTREYLQYVKQSGQALLEIINDILDLSKIELAKADLVSRPFRLREVLDSTLKPLSVSAASKGLRYEHNVDGNVPDHLAGDPGRLRQILTNLISNAIKFTADGTVRISVEVNSQPASPGTVRLLFTVRDDGIGISKDRLEAVFEAFSQVGLSSHVNYGGTGLGLSISKSLVEMMGGRIWAKSEVGQGSTFNFTAVFGLVQEGELPKAVIRPVVSPPPAMLNILLAEDCKVNQILAVELLELCGHRVEVVENGLEALEKLKTHRFNLVFLDVRMPVMDGIATTHAIRSGEAGQDNVGIPIVATTAYALNGDREKFLADGMDDYLSKPFDIDALDQVLARMSAAVNVVR